MKVAIVSSGLGHVYRGIERWALSTANGLQDIGLAPVAFGGSVLSGRPRPFAYRCIPCQRRGTLANRWFVRLASRLGGWRWGGGSDYQWEQDTFARRMIRHLKTDPFDIIHLQDPWLAWRLESAVQKGVIKTRVILAHGTDESLPFLNRFHYLQELSPEYVQHHGASDQGPKVFMIPNAVNTEEFYPASSTADDRLQWRRSLSLPPDATVIGCVAALEAGRKRCDVLIEEFAKAAVSSNVYLLLVGATTPETGAIIDKARQLSPDRIRVARDIPYEQMSGLYRTMDVFALCALREIFGLCFLEAMSTGIPCIGHDYPITRWIIGEAGVCVDTTRPGALAGLLESIDNVWIKKHSQTARERASTFFCEPVVARQMVEMYRQVLSG